MDALKVERATTEVLLTHPLIAEALSASDLSRMDYFNGLRRLLQRGFMPQRSGDVLFAYRPGFFEPYDKAPHKGTTHGSGWNYDTHVPILLMGRGIQHREVNRRISITDIAPTIALIAGMTMPDASSGTAVLEVLAP